MKGKKLPKTRPEMASLSSPTSVEVLGAVSKVDIRNGSDSDKL